MTIRHAPTPAPHVPLAHELLRAYQLAKSLAEALEVALPAAHHEAVQLRERIFEAWAATGQVVEAFAVAKGQVGESH